MVSAICINFRVLPHAAAFYWEKRSVMMHKLVTRIKEQKIFNHKTFSGNIDDLLDFRDEVEFDSEWMRIYDVLEQYSMDEDTEKEIAEVRQAAFQTAYDLSNSSDIAACVSDDFEIICKAYVIGLKDRWMNGLVKTYVQHRFPCCGRMEASETDVDTAYDSLFGDD